jgi:hypothetical protein
MITFIKYAFFFGAVFVLFMGLAIFALMETMGGSAGVVGWWRDYDDDIGQITVFKTKIGFWRGQKLYEVQGHWDHKTFHGGAEGASPEAVVAEELPDEDLQIHMVYFDPADTRTVTAVMLSRQSTDFHPYPCARRGSR